MTARINDFVRAWWPVAIAIAALCAAWGATTMQIAALGTGQERMLAKQDQFAQDLRRIGEAIAADHARGQFNTEAIAELRARVRDLEARR